MPDNYKSTKIKKEVLGAALTPKFFCVCHEADTFLASEIDRLD